MIESIMIDSEEPMDDQRFRDMMAATPAPVTVVTTADQDGPGGCTVSAFMSLSMSPRMIAVALDNRSSLLPRVVATGEFGVNLLAAAQADVALKFARPAPDRFVDVAWFADRGMPRLHGVAGWLRCRLAHVVDAGDHALLMGEVEHAVPTTASPMVYAQRLFGGHSGIEARPVPDLDRHLAACAR
jgi:flavin reductase (DIM6/NTAB) family NADH-FMN oxidoreductase RutF